MNNAIEKQDFENLKLGVHEMAEEVKDLNRTQVTMVDTINHLSGKMSKLDERISKINTEPPVFDMNTVEETLKKGLLDMSEMVADKIKNSSRKFQILLFPPQDAGLFYKVVFGRWFLYALIGFAIQKTYEWAVHESNNRARVKMEEARIEVQEIGDGALYDRGSKSPRQQMEKALIESTP